ncbi:MAG TPA: hypothetical protein HA263_01720 [Methanoregulaceae archaeon]|nr:hypothetical protein [Methanoregulaceae archaeon]
MALHFTFNLKIQAAYGIFGFLSTLVILYLILGQVSLLTALFVGTGNFLVAGFYTEYYRTV